MSIESNSESGLRKFAKTSLRNTPRALLAAGALGGAFLLGRQDIDFPDIDSKPADNTEKLFYGENIDQEIGPEEAANMALNFMVAKDYFGTFLNYKLTTNQSNDISDELNRERTGLVLDGAKLVNLIDDEENFEINTELGIVRLSEQDLRFKLGDNYSEALLMGIIDQLIVMNAFGGILESKEAAIRDFKDLLWLSKEELPIEFEESFYWFQEGDVLATTARFYRTMQELNYSIAPQITFRQAIAGDSGYAGNYDWYGDDSINIVEYADVRTPVHEEAHQQADNNPKFSQEKFNKLFNAAARRSGIDVRDSRLHITPYPASLDNSERILQEAYAEVISQYFVDGKGFRDHLKYLYVTDMAAFTAQKVQYEFAKDFFQGRGYSFEGEIFAPDVGEVFTISDPDPSDSPSGIFLRSDSLKWNSDLGGQVRDEDVVQIIDGPSKMYNPYIKEFVDAWKIRRISISLDGTKLTDEEGWIWDIWLGNTYSIKAGELQE